MFQKLSENLEKAGRELNYLKKDIENSKNPLENKLQPMTRLRANIVEVEKAKENPELQKIKDRLSDILKGI
jgi:predicted  nucleic acid-binding Zn-ribbon protein